MRLVRPVLAVLLSVLLIPAGAWAQAAGPRQHVADRAAVDRLLTAQADQASADRDAIRTLLRHPDVREIADRYGLSIERAEAAVNAMSGDQLHQLAGQARQADQALSGGASTIVLSTTTLIIILLVVILLVVALK